MRSGTRTICCAIMACGCLLTEAKADEPKVRKPGPLKLVVEVDSQEIPPLLPMEIIVRLKNAHDETVTLFGEWKMGLSFHIWKGANELGKTGYGNLPLDTTKKPLKPQGAVVHVYPWLPFGEDVTALMQKPGTYRLIAKNSLYYLWNDETDRFYRVDGEAYAEIEIPELTSEIEVKVRPPTPAEQGAVDLLRKSSEARRMISLSQDRNAYPWNWGVPYSNPNGTKVLLQISKEFPGTIYADYANYVLGRTVYKVDAAKKAVDRNVTTHEHVRYLKKVGENSPFVHQRAKFWIYHEMTQNYNYYPEVDWKAVPKEMKSLADIAKLLESESFFETQMLPVAREMAKDGSIDLGDLK